MNLQSYAYGAAISAPHDYQMAFLATQGLTESRFGFTSRSRLERLIDVSVRILDNLDGDCDFEDDGNDEPALGWCGNGALATMGTTDDRENDPADDELTGDDEPSLGSLACNPNYMGTGTQDNWCGGMGDDLEEGSDNGIADTGGLMDQQPLPHQVYGEVRNAGQHELQRLRVLRRKAEPDHEAVTMVPMMTLETLGRLAR